MFSLPGSTRQDRKRIFGPGFATKSEAEDAEARHRTDELQKRTLEKPGAGIAAPGVPLPVVSARLGHSSVRVTAGIYAHMIHGQDDEAALRWDKFRERSTPEKRVGEVQ